MNRMQTSPEWTLAYQITLPKVAARLMRERRTVGSTAREDFKWWSREVRKWAHGRYDPAHAKAHLGHVKAACDAVVGGAL